MKIYYKEVKEDRMLRSYMSSTRICCKEFSDNVNSFYINFNGVKVKDAVHIHIGYCPYCGDKTEVLKDEII